MTLDAACPSPPAVACPSGRAEGRSALTPTPTTTRRKPLPPCPTSPTAHARIVAAAALRPKKTRPPKRYTEGDLIGDMLDVGKFATNPEVRKRLKENAGIGTEANARQHHQEPAGTRLPGTPGQVHREHAAGPRADRHVARSAHRCCDDGVVGRKAGRTSPRHRSGVRPRRIRFQDRRQRRPHHRIGARRRRQGGRQPHLGEGQVRYARRLPLRWAFHCRRTWKRPTPPCKRSSTPTATPTAISCQARSSSPSRKSSPARRASR